MIINNKRIAKNTLYMYMRMTIVMVVQLYTSRIILSVLGFENYGIYSVIASFVIAVTFIKTPIGSTTQRFLNYEIGLGKDGRPHLIFNISFIIYIAISLLLFLVLEIVGNWYIFNKMQIPDDRFNAALFAFQFVLISFVLNFLKIPYESLIVAYEKMSFYAFQSIVEVFLKLSNALILCYVGFDKLKLLVVNYALIDALLLLILIIYCRRNFPKYKVQKKWDQAIFVKLVGFAGWTFLGAFSEVCLNQGTNILFNLYYGVVVNAAMGIAVQVNSAINNFAVNFQTSFRPQVIKGYAAGEIDDLKELVYRTSKFSYLLLFAVVVPVVFNCDYILSLWLEKVPLYTSAFCIILMVENLIYVLGGPMWMTVYAAGNMKMYQLTISLIEIMSLPMSLVLLKLGYGPSFVLCARCLIAIAVLCQRFIFMKIIINLSIYRYAIQVLLPLVTMTFLICSIMYAVSLYGDNGFSKFVHSAIAYLFIFPITAFFIVLNRNEKQWLMALVGRYVNNNKFVQKRKS